MSEEYLDIINENGTLTGERQLRSVCHVQGLWHRTVHIYLFRRLGDELQLLTHLRSLSKETSPGKWVTSFGGHVKSGESIEEAIINEVEEEIGLKIRMEDLFKGLEKRYENSTNCEYTFIYYLPYDGDISKLIFNDGEVQKVEWRSFEDVESELEKNRSLWSTSTTKENLNLVKIDLLKKISE